MVELTAERLQAAAAEYRDREPFVEVERDRLETMPAAFAEGSYLWKDVEWIVRWYCRRPLPGDNRDPEDEFRNNDMETIEGAIDAATDAAEVVPAVNALIALEGVNVPIASAFLYYSDPDRYIPMTEETWTVLAEADRLGQPWPDACTPSDYERFLATCRRLADETDLPLRDVERALWQCSGVRT